eukprot:gene2383-2848_t
MRICTCCSKDTESEVYYSVNSRNIKAYSAVLPNIKEGILCCTCYNKWRTKVAKDPRMCLKTLFCGICQKEEPEVQFSEKFKRINGRNCSSYSSRASKPVLIGPICRKCNKEYPAEIVLKSEKMTPKKTTISKKEKMKEKKTELKKTVTFVDKDENTIDGDITVDLRKYFPNDSFLKMPTLFRCKKQKK